MLDIKSSLMKRVLSSVVLIPLLLYVLYLGTPFTDALLVGLFLVCAWEWGRLCWTTKKLNALPKKGLIFGAGMLYLCTSFYALLTVSHNASMTLFGILMMVWASDTGAYFVGSLVGGPKMCPSISPNKTWSGFFGGLVLTLCVGYALVTYAQWSVVRAPQSSMKTMVSVGLIAFISPLGDMFESWVKRRFGVKDTGNLIPGHGGALDRLDSIIAVGFVLFFFVTLCPKF